MGGEFARNKPREGCAAVKSCRAAFVDADLQDGGIGDGAKTNRE
jgi:hypothetical protein